MGGIYNSNTTSRWIHGPCGEKIQTGTQKSSILRAIHPYFFGVDFGPFRIPNREQATNEPWNASSIINDLLELTRSTRSVENSKKSLAPPETGRAYLLESTNDSEFSEFLVKGCGLVERFTIANKLRLPERGFDGFLELSEAGRDFVNSDILIRAGARVAFPVAIFDHNQIINYTNFRASTCNYVRAFRSQTRISNLFELSLPERKAALEEAKDRLSRELKQGPLSWVDYFYKILHFCARNAAILQATGFTQNGLHYGQVTLAGELADMGIGTFIKPMPPSGVNTIYPWFRYERQPYLMLNILFRTHSLKSEPTPVRLPSHSNTMRNQQTLWSAIRSIDAQSAEEIAFIQPETQFWSSFQKEIEKFPTTKFHNSVIINRFADYFDLPIDLFLKKLPRETRILTEKFYTSALTLLRKNYEEQESTWERLGPIRMMKMELLRSVCPIAIPHVFGNHWGKVTLNQPNENQGYVEQI